MNIAITSFEKSESAIRAVRDAVFGREQKVPPELDWDGGDPQCVHVVATDDGGNPIGTGRLRLDGKIGRMAVAACWRGRGVGGGMLEALIASARSRGIPEVHLNAQTRAVPFYEKSGFQRAGAEFMEAGMRHVKMTRPTQPSSRGDIAGRAELEK